MASGSYFKPNNAGYLAVLNGAEARTACEVRAGALAASAARQSGTSYAIDSMQGLHRIHTRVSTVGAADYFRERQYRALAIAVGASGGRMRGAKSYRTLAAAHKTGMRKHNRAAWKRSYSQWR